MVKKDVVQFIEGHKWCGCLGIIEEVKELKNDIRYLVGVPMPLQGITYIFVLKSENAIERIGQAILVAR